MAFFFTQPVQKARRRRWRSTRTVQRVRALSLQMGNAMGAHLAKGLVKFKWRLDPERIYQAWLSGDYTRVIQAVPWHELPGNLEDAFKDQGTAFGEGLNLGAMALPKPKHAEFRLDTKSPLIRDYIATRTGDVYSNLTDSSARNIQSWTQKFFSHALSPKRVAAGIRDSIGLLPAHQNAVENYRMGLLAGGQTQAQADALAGGYANRLLDYRSMMIGRTETKGALNGGQLEVWKQGADQGFIDRTVARKGWLCGGEDPCELCEPMDGVTVLIDEPFTLPDGSTCDFPPDGTHPHCDCDLYLDIDGDSAPEGDNG